MMELTDPQSYKDLSSPRVFNTHLRFRHLPRDMISRSCKIIYIGRNPKDMAVSRYHHNVKGSVGYKGTFSDYLPMYLDGKGKMLFLLNSFLQMGGSRGEQGVKIPLKNHKNIGFLSIIGLDPLKNHKATKPAFKFGPLSARQRIAI